MKYIITTSLLLFTALLHISFAQQTPVELWRSFEFVKELNSSRNPTIQINKNQQTYMLTTRSDGFSMSGTRLVKYDTNGSVLWKKESQNTLESHRYTSFIVDSVGNAYIGYEYAPWDVHPPLRRYSPEGELLWERTYFPPDQDPNSSSTIFFSDLDTINGRLIVAGSYSNQLAVEDNFLFVAAVDTADGSVIWRTDISSKRGPINMRVLSDRIELFYRKLISGEGYYNITQMDFNGNLIQEHENAISDFYGGEIAANGDVIFFRINGYGAARITPQVEILWEYSIPVVGGSNKNWVRSVTEDEDFNTYITGTSQGLGFDFMTTKISPSGQVIWENRYQYQQDSISEVGQGVFVGSDYAISIGSIKPTTKQKALINVFDKIDGELEYTIVLEDSMNMIGVEVIQAANKLFYTAFKFEGAESTSIVTGCIALPIISATSSAQQSDLVSIYPNPSPDNIMVSGIDTQAFESIQVSDARGQVVLNEKATQSSATFSLTHLPPGVYVVSLVGPKITLSKKVVKL